MSIVQPYKKEFTHSYTSGAYATIELIKARPDIVETVLIHSAFQHSTQLEMLCVQNKIPFEHNDNAFRRIRQKENSFVCGLLRKYPSELEPDRPHVVLVNPSDMGNLGTIIRTLVGFRIPNLAVITPAADIWDPRTIRASMGSLFHLNFRHFDDIEQYRAQFPAHRLFPFMSDGGLELRPDNVPAQPLFSLVFGNEASGLDERYRQMGASVRIAQSPHIDSLNLSVAVAVGTYLFCGAYLCP